MLEIPVYPKACMMSGRNHIAASSNREANVRQTSPQNEQAIAYSLALP
jgi:hypothetical protein